jgi:hypothetical protein
METAAAYWGIPDQVYRYTGSKEQQEKTDQSSGGPGAYTQQKQCPAYEFDPGEANRHKVHAPIWYYLVACDSFGEFRGIIDFVHAGIDEQPPKIEPEDQSKVAIRKNFFQGSSHFSSG